MNYLFLIGQNYSFDILRPLQQEAKNRGDKVLWFAYQSAVNTGQFQDTEEYTTDINEAIAFAPDACFAPGNIAPRFIPGLKVQVFHGLERKKKGHFRIRDCFDLYCTQGPLFTEKFQALAQQHGNFDVIETGWPKLDSLFNATPLELNDKTKPCILYAPTFSPALCSTPDLYDQIKDLRDRGDYQWLVKFHPKMDVNWLEKFKQLQNEQFKVIESGALAPILQAADMMVSDTSSIITEFMLLNKPVVTYKNLAPEPCLIDIQQPDHLEKAIENALEPSASLLKEMQNQNAKMHPYSDGLAAKRILDATEQTLKNGKRSKPLPLNLIRNLKMRKLFGYWKL